MDGCTASSRTACPTPSAEAGRPDAVDGRRTASRLLLLAALLFGIWVLLAAGTERAQATEGTGSPVADLIEAAEAAGISVPPDWSLPEGAQGQPPSHGNQPGPGNSGPGNGGPSDSGPSDSGPSNGPAGQPAGGTDPGPQNPPSPP